MIRYPVEFCFRGFLLPSTWDISDPEHNTKNKNMGDTAVGVSVAVYGILSPDFGCSCEHHTVCGENIYLDMLVRFKSVIVEGGECFL